MKDLMHIFTTICLAGMMLSLLLFAVAWMCEQRFNLYRKVQAIFHRSFVETFLLLLFCIGLIHVGSTKNAGGTSNDTELSLMTDIAGVQVPIIESLALPVDMPMMITNLSICAITPAEISVFLSAIWPEGCAIPNSKLSVYALHDLVTNGWEKVAVASLPSDAMKAEIELPHAILPKGCDSKSFFTVGTLHDSDCDGIADSDERLLLNTDPRCDDSDGDSYPDGEELHSGTEPNMADTDGDGLSDGDEAGSISVMPYFEWYQEPAMSSVRSISPLIESYFGTSAILQLSYPTTIRGRKCVQVVAFDNGYVALTSPGDFNGWSFPSGPMHLNEHCYNNGSILIAPYWSSQQVTSLVTNSWLKAWNDESRNVAVAEFNNVLCDVNKYMTFQVVIPYGTGNVVKVSFKSSDIPLDGTYAVSGFHHKGYEATNGIYNVEWDFARRGEIPVGKTLEYRFGVGTNPLSADSDGDGVRDDVEFALGIKPLNPDTDSDGLNDGMELDIGTNPLSSDTDNDGLLDKWEIDNGLNPKSSESDDGASGDADGDGLSNLEEAVIGSNPANGDTDGDGLNDSQEILYGTDFSSPDTDKDGLLDGQEIEMALNPLQPDTDGDGIFDGEEIILSSNPLSPDTDGDGMNDGWESRQDGFDPSVDNSTDTNPNNDLNADPDGDGLTNGEESEAGTNPGKPDTDGDGLNDGVEIGQGSDPNDRADAIPVKWVSVTGDLEQNVTKQVHETVIIPAGTMAFIGVFLQSDEYPDYTSTGSKFNDRAVWDIHADGNTSLSGFTLVNNEDGSWDEAGANNHSANGRSPVVLKDKAIYKASGDSDLSVNINLAAMNISDDIRPTTVFVGVFPLKVVQANKPTGIGESLTTDAGTSYFRAFIPTNGVAYITAAPAAPQLTAQFKGLPSWIRASWSGSLTTERSERNTVDNRTLIAQNLAGDEVYDISNALNKEIVGGKCILNVAIEGVSSEYPFSIRGKNPCDATALAYINSRVDTDFQSYAWMIAKHESKSGSRLYNQFNPTGTKAELPNWGSPYGWGIAQIDKGLDGDTTAEVYNWHENISSMNEKLKSALNTYNRFVGYYRELYANDTSTKWTEPDDVIAIVDGYEVSAKMWSVLTFYNGAGGCPRRYLAGAWRLVPLEFDPATTNWILYANSQDYVNVTILDRNQQGTE